ncbi:MAG: homoserine dehydrogenase, partial [Coriobacteriales bacterium]|nr:homoserine dehydrogenase [Coriobacteriales bacterium]
MRPINVGIMGLGTVGASVAKMILMHGEDYKRYYGLDIRLIAAAALDDTAVKELGIEDVFTFDGNDVIDNPDVDVVIELIGGTGIAKKFVLKALNAGKHVVTANKAIMASCGEEILKTAQANGVSIMYGASVGGGIPIIGPLKRSLDCNEISDVMGIVNGTTNYMLTRMSDDGMDYEAALKEAQEKGFAEFNPAGDVEGLDAANKIAILASIAFHSRVTIEDVYVEGITKIEPIDLDVARDMGYCIKLLAIARRTENGIDVRVHPTMLPLSHPLAGVNGVFNAIYVVGDFVGETMFFGQGAGGGAAASA